MCRLASPCLCVGIPRRRGQEGGSNAAAVATWTPGRLQGPRTARWRRLWLGPNPPRPPLQGPVSGFHGPAAALASASRTGIPGPFWIPITQGQKCPHPCTLAVRNVLPRRALITRRAARPAALLPRPFHSAPQGRPRHRVASPWGHLQGAREGSSCRVKRRAQPPRPPRTPRHVPLSPQRVTSSPRLLKQFC